MRAIAGYVIDYFRQIDRVRFIFITFILSILVVINYTCLLNRQILLLPSWGKRFAGMYALYLFAFAVPRIIEISRPDRQIRADRVFWLLVLLAPAVFALKVVIRVQDLWEVGDQYLQVVLQWPLKAVVTAGAVCLLWRMAGRAGPIAGVTTRNFRWSPYLFILLMTVPLVLWAGTRYDFQAVYPKLRMAGEARGGWKSILFELSYGIDFLTIELFFRGFLVLAFIKYGGYKAVLPMASFYCTIHFGKPMAECISSYFGGIILGAVISRTGSVWGGLTVHLGIAWLMELVGATM